MKKEMEDDTLLNILFDYNRDNYCFLVFFQKKGIGKIPLTREFYRQVEGGQVKMQLKNILWTAL